MNVDLDAILAELGGFHRFQILSLFFMQMPILHCAMIRTQYIFAAEDLNYRCKVPECESSPTQFETNGWGVWALPESGGRCERLAPVGGGCTPDSFHPSDTVPCDSWVYEHNNSIVSEFDLACQNWKRTLVGTMHSAGIFFAMPLTAYVSDTFGRRVAFVLTAVTPALAGVIRSFSVNYVMYVVFEFLDAVLGAGVYPTGFVLALEMVGIKMRVLGGNILSSTFALGQVVVALLAWKWPHWKTLTLILYIPPILFIFYFFVIEESVRWLLSKGRRKEAARIIFKVADINKRKLSPETIKQLTEESAENSKGGNEFKSGEANTSSIALQVLKSRVLMVRLSICSFWWISVTFIYYGLSINSVSLAGNSYLNFIFTALIEIPGYFLSAITLDRYGRKRSIMTSFFICGISLVTLPFIPDSLQWLQTSLNLLGKLFISMVFSSIYVYTGELYPTGIRQRMIAVCSMAGRIGQMVAPQTPLLMEYMHSLPYVMFGVMAACSALLMTLTPETLRLRLPDTIHQAETISDAAKARGNPPLTIQ